MEELDQQEQDAKNLPPSPVVVFQRVYELAQDAALDHPLDSSDVGQLKQEVELLKRRLAETHEQLEELEDELEDKEFEVSFIQSEKEEEVLRRGDAVWQYAMVLNDIKRVTEEKTKQEIAYNTTLQSLTEENQALRQELCSLRETLTRKEEEENLRTQKEHERLEEELRAARSDVKKFQDLKAQLLQLREEYDLKTVEWESKMGTQISICSEQTSTIEKLRAQITEARCREIELMTRLDVREGDVDKLQNNFSCLREEISLLRKSMLSESSLNKRVPLRRMQTTVTNSPSKQNSKDKENSNTASPGRLYKRKTVPVLVSEWEHRSIC
eukprot:GILJ01006729.1.p1 GENE.GILJ01006729.1~~GILJ01006729.1.p1  ORF type:complete len:354 (-),score=87.81 GILJ01006729.1:274-1254(-)